MGRLLSTSGVSGSALLVRAEMILVASWLYVKRNPAQSQYFLFVLLGQSLIIFSVKLE
jgi:hypothetical protein